MKQLNLTLFSLFVITTAISARSNEGSEPATSGDAALRWGETYAGVFAGSGGVYNRIVDVDGFANWGNPGSTVDYDDAGFVVGLLVGKKFEIGDMPLRVEVDGTLGEMSANTNKLDPVGLDETAESEFPWIATARVGIEQAMGRATVFATGGLAAARIDNSVTDIDFGRDMPARMDPDDSFRDSSTEIGWVIGAGVETSLSDAWMLRIEGLHLDFGQGIHYVNRSGNNRCGPGNPRRSCPYNLENKLGIVRLAIIYSFGR